MTLEQTAKLMSSDNYKDRFRAEYYQTKIRYNKLHKMIIKYEADTLGFEPNCSIELLSRGVIAHANANCVAYSTNTLLPPKQRHIIQK